MGAGDGPSPDIQRRAGKSVDRERLRPDGGAHNINNRVCRPNLMKVDLLYVYFVDSGFCCP